MSERDAIVALLRAVGLHEPGVADRLQAGETAGALLAEQLGAGTSLLAEDPEPRLRAACAERIAWERAGIELLDIREGDRYPVALRTVHDRPALLFLRGDVELATQATGIALVGSRRATDAGLARARRFAAELAGAGHAIISGLAAGIDTAAHRAATEAGGRTIAVIGTGIDVVHPPANADLQARLAVEHAVLSPFWPDASPEADAFRRRNAIMSGLSVGTVILEASARSGTRVQARRALAHGRPVFLVRALLDQLWARELARRPGVHVVDGPADVLAQLRRMSDGPLTEPTASSD